MKLIRQTSVFECRMIVSCCLIAVLMHPAVAQDATAPAKFEPSENKSNDESVEKRIAAINAEVTKSVEQQLASLPEIDEKDPESVQLLSSRGDLLMFLARFEEAEHDFQQMAVLKPSLDAGHWRLGIANYFAGHPDRGAAQFEKYHSFDSVDRENGIWRYFCHFKSEGREAAQKQLLRYDKDDRPPFREVYQLFQGTMTPADVLKACEGKDGDGKDSLRFYSHLYVGLNASLENQPAEAIRHLQLATLNPWPRKAGFGPEWMWHVGRLELNGLTTRQNKSDQDGAKVQK
ncbi:MAG: hypothetical protein JNM43_03650 [Planctomycetaceae bacterium]|nr:hypothetical protein [Planctomycetaceae bacterium]